MWTAGVKKIFPLAALLGGISQHWEFLANFWDLGRAKLHELVILWVWEIIRRERRQEVQGWRSLTALYKIWIIFPIKSCFEKNFFALNTSDVSWFDPNLRLCNDFPTLRYHHIKRNFLDFRWSNSIFRPDFHSELVSLWDCVCLANKLAQSSFFTLL